MSAQVQRKLEFPVKKPARSTRTSKTTDDCIIKRETRSTRRSKRNQKNALKDENVPLIKDCSYRSPRKRHSSGKRTSLHVEKLCDFCSGLIQTMV